MGGGGFCRMFFVVTLRSFGGAPTFRTAPLVSITSSIESFHGQNLADPWGCFAERVKVRQFN